MPPEQGKIYIGTGGWSYFNVPGDRLQAYSRCFDFVEVNSSFYRYLDPATASSWRRRVPKSFLFAVRCHRDVTHRLKLTQAAIEPYFRFLRSVEALNPDVIVFETPSEFTPSESNIANAMSFFSRIDTDRSAIAWEVRGRSWQTSEAREKLLKILSDFDITHCVDLSQDDPAYMGKLVYSRLFGPSKETSMPNKYEFEDNELLNIHAKAQAHSKEGRKVALSFHGIRMYHDAARLKRYSETGRFPTVTSHTGPQSLKEILEEEVTFPSTKRQILERAGWRLLDWTEDQRVRASTLLEQIEDARYETAEEVLAKVMEKSRECAVHTPR